MPGQFALDDDRVLHALVFAGVARPVRDLINRVSALDGGLPLLRFLYAHANALLTIDDIAYHVKSSPASVIQTLTALVDLGLVRDPRIAGHVFYGVTADPDGRQRVRELCDWQDRWHTRLAQIGHLVDGEPGATPAPDHARFETTTPFAAPRTRLDSDATISRP